MGARSSGRGAHALRRGVGRSLTVARHRPLDALCRVVYRLGYPVLRAYRLVVGPEVHGVRCVVTHGDRLLLVRHTYGDRSRWELPGGLLKPGEAADTAAARELEEEIGLHGEGWRDLGTRRSHTDRTLEIVRYLRTEVRSDAVRLNRAELSEAGWFEGDRLPPRAADYIAPLLARSKSRLDHVRVPRSGARSRRP